MKKTRKTMITSALLSAAVALQNQQILTMAREEAIPQPDYGPMPVKGDFNHDGQTDIVDYILAKSCLSGDTDKVWNKEYVSDLDGDENFTPDDIAVFQRYLFGKIPDVENVYPEDRDDNPEVINVPDNPEIIQTKYGCPVPEPTVVPVYGCPVTEPTAIAEPTVVPVYGCPVTEPTAVVEPTLVPVYGCPVTAEEPSAVTEPSAEPSSAVTSEEEPVFSSSEVPQVVYGPPSYFE